MKKTIRNLMIGTTSLLGVSHMIQKITKMKMEKSIAKESKIIEDAQFEVPIYHTIGVIVKENDKVKVKEMKEWIDSSKVAV